MSKMTWHDVPEDYKESPYVDSDTYTGYDGDNNAYGERNYQQTTKTTITPRLSIDEDIRLMNEQYRNPNSIPEVYRRPIEAPLSCKFNFTWRVTSTTRTDRNIMRISRLNTPIESLVVWGLTSWMEFKPHIHVDDKLAMSKYREELIADIALTRKPGTTEVCYWVARDEQGPRPGWWAISIDFLDTQTRYIFTSWNDQTTITEELKLKNNNSITYHWKSNEPPTN